MGVDANMKGVVKIPELGLVGSVVDELIITLFFGCLRGGFVAIGVAQRGEGVISISHPEYSPTLFSAGCVAKVVTLFPGG